MDITEKKTLQTQLSQAQKLESVGRLAGGVAHDFNNMLGVILGHVELALLQTDENHDLHADLKEIQTAATRSADITKQLLAFARKQTISPKRLDLNGVEKATNHSGSIDLLMSDVVMPEMNGRDLAAQIIRFCPGIRLLFMSGYTADVIAHQGMLDDGVVFIQKPFSMTDMTQTVRKILDSAPDKN